MRPHIPSHTKSSVLLVASTSVATALAWASATTSTTEASYKEVHPHKHRKLEVDFLDRIGQKMYIRQYFINRQQVPLPSSVRILSIDVPEMRREALEGGRCRMVANRVYTDGVAPPFRVSRNVRVVQKSLAQAFVEYYNPSTHKVGIEILEVSISNLNRFHLVQTDDRSFEDEDDGPEAGLPESEDDTTDYDDAISSDPSKVTSDQDELEAPWNQYAWKEELKLRISGHVPFGAAMERPAQIRSLFSRSVYKSTVPSSRTLWDWFLPPVLRQDPAGTDSAGNRNFASSRPHAVIANGSALRRVPGSLPLLQQHCQEANIPLFIIDDPRGRFNTHASFEEAVSDMRKAIKTKVVTQTMRQGSTFAQGRLVGKLEAELKFKAKELERKAKDAARNYKNDLKRKKDADWSDLDEESLALRLLEKRVIRPGENEQRAYSKGMLELARRCLDDEEQKSPVANDNVSTESDGAVPVA